MLLETSCRITNGKLKYFQYSVDLFYHLSNFILIDLVSCFLSFCHVNVRLPDS